MNAATQYRTVELPDLEDVAAGLVEIWRHVESEDVDVRLQVTEDGAWYLHSGDASYDQDHRGFWGAGSLPGKAERSSLGEKDRARICRMWAEDLLDEVREEVATAGE
jgi:hypothetical protein